MFYGHFVDRETTTCPTLQYSLAEPPEADMEKYLP